MIFPIILKHSLWIILIAVKETVIWKRKISVTSNARSIFNTKPGWVSVSKLKYSSEFTSLGGKKVKYKGMKSWREKREGEMRGEKYTCMWCWKAKLSKFIFHFNTLVHRPWVLDILQISDIAVLYHWGSRNVNQTYSGTLKKHS